MFWQEAPKPTEGGRVLMRMDAGGIDPNDPRLVHDLGRTYKSQTQSKPFKL